MPLIAFDCFNYDAAKYSQTHSESHFNLNYIKLTLKKIVES